ncbi:MAG TPA: C48 family peptidase [Rickettsia endosymbiont of Pyrocoelia pectoralis]|nr:C48 family peptidase [Rickettsia endosymbiont of Pyrocoelia pectoralis]
MAKPIIFTLLLGNNDQILEKINTQEAQSTPTIVPLRTNKESHISDKDRIFAEILKESIKQGKDPIFNVQLNNNDIKPIFKSQDLTNLQNLNIKSTITFDRYNSLAENPELAKYWQEILAKADHVFFANKEDQELAIKENIVSKEKTTSIKDTDIDSVISVFNNLTDDKKVNKLLSDTIPDKTNLDKIINTAKNQGGRVIIKAWPLALDDATTLIASKFGIKSEDQIYGLKLEVNEILKDPINAPENLQKYVSQISEQFQKDRGIAEINPIDFNFDREKIMKNKDDIITQETTTPYEQKKENQPEPEGFFRKLVNYFKNMVTAIFNKKEETPAPTKQSPQYDHDNIVHAHIETQDISNIKKPNYLYTEDDIKNILEANIDKNKFSIFHHASLTEPEILKDTLQVAVNDLVVNNKPAIIPLNTGHEHWLTLMATQDDKGNVTFIYNDPTGRPIEDRPEIKKYINEVYPGVEIKDLKTPQQQNAYDCGVFVCDNLIKMSKNENILSTEQSKGQGTNLRNAQAGILATNVLKQQAQEIGRQAQNKQPAHFQKLVESQRTNNKPRQR